MDCAGLWAIRKLSMSSDLFVRQVGLREAQNPRRPVYAEASRCGGFPFCLFGGLPCRFLLRNVDHPPEKELALLCRSLVFATLES
jgi:hypothetical protein